MLILEYMFQYSTLDSKEGTSCTDCICLYVDPFRITIFYMSPMQEDSALGGVIIPDCSFFVPLEPTNVDPKT